MPAFDVTESQTIRLARLNVLGIELRFQLASLLIGECHHLVLTLSTGWELES
jgi:hypothetical protein